MNENWVLVAIAGHSGLHEREREREREYYYYYYYP